MPNSGFWRRSVLIGLFFSLLVALIGFSNLLPILGQEATEESPPPATEIIIPSLTPTETPTETATLTPSATVSETATETAAPTLTPTGETTAEATTEITSEPTLTLAATASETATAAPVDDRLDAPPSPTVTTTLEPTFTPTFTPTAFGIPYFTPEAVEFPPFEGDFAALGAGTNVASVAQLRSAMQGCTDPLIQMALNLTSTSDYVLTNSVESFFGGNGLPVVRCDLTINGNNKVIRRGSGAPAFRIFSVDTSARLTLNSLIVRGGLVNQTGGAGIFSNYGTVILNNATVTQNNINSSSTLAVIGAGIYSYYRALQVNSNSIISNNTNTATQPIAWADGGGIGINNGTAIIRNSTISGNVAKRGGGIAGHIGAANIIIRESIILDNRATNAGGGVYSDGNYVSITRTNFRNNAAQTSGQFSGGGLALTNGLTVYSCITGNQDVSLWAQPGTTVNAPENWWGVGGPGAPGTTGVDTKSTIVNIDVTGYIPYIKTAPPGSPADCRQYTPPPTPGICTTGMITTGCPPTPTPTPWTLADFGILLEGTWSTGQQSAILTAATLTGTALSLHGAAPTALEAFREVMLGMNGSQWRTIKFRRMAQGGIYCSTTKNPTATESAYIDCDPTVIMNEYTAVHEFGHVLVGRTTVNDESSYYNIIEDPDGGGSTTNVLKDFAGDLVMGERGYALSTGELVIDWQRSDVDRDNGWGSAALWDQQSYYGPYLLQPPPVPPGTPTPRPGARYIPKIGPCGLGAPTPQPTPSGPPFPFQQNPCTFPSWLLPVGSLGRIVEIEEAAADMFLNWVYRKSNGNSAAFLDKLWRSAPCYPNGCDDPNLSGEARMAWMNQTMTSIFAEFDW